MQLGFHTMQPDPAIGDELERCYTPERLSLIILSRLSKVISPKVMIEPSVGGGTFVRSARKVWPGIHVIGVDMDPRATGLQLVDEGVIGDWPNVAKCIAEDMRDACLIAGNPPFSEAIAHVNAAREHHPRAALSFILPWGYWGVGEWQPVFQAHRVSSLYPILGRPWPKRMRETAAYNWLGSEQTVIETVIDNWKT